MPLRPERRRFGDYHIVKPLASGGMCGVYLAQHALTGERVAIKVLDAQLADHGEVVSRMFAERTVSAKARHAGLVEVRAAGRDDGGVPYLVMEYIDGDTLAALVDDGARLPISMIARIGAQLASALAALHAAGYVHCDVKPDNVLISRDGDCRVTLIDYGVARGCDEPPADDASIAGTPAYMAPEQWRGRPVPASDVYALGCLLFELVTGDTPFDGSLPQLMLSHLEQRAPRLSWLRAGVPLDFELAVLRALAKDPGLRPSMRELAAALDAVADGASASDTMRLAV